MNRLASIDELEGIAKELVVTSQGAKVWLFFGEMGSGKTTIIKHICTHLGVKERVSSPTFTIINEYQALRNSTIYHFDFYRLTKVSGAYDIGTEEYFESGSYCFVEWPEIIQSICPATYFKVKIKIVSQSKRMIDYSLTSP